MQGKEPREAEDLPNTGRCDRCSPDSAQNTCNGYLCLPRIPCVSQPASLWHANRRSRRCTPVFLLASTSEPVDWQSLPRPAVEFSSEPAEPNQQGADCWFRLPLFAASRLPIAVGQISKFHDRCDDADGRTAAETDARTISFLGAGNCGWRSAAQGSHLLGGKVSRGQYHDGKHLRESRQDGKQCYSDRESIFG